MTFKTFLAENLVFFFGFALLLFMAAAVMGTLWLLMQAGERWLRERLNLPKEGEERDDGTLS
ncbi:MAG: hypothetical protein E7475_08005 [Ruminococcaceae bacterium]|nr:hypothetical protein [Oscillospiraceae bacterium]